MSLIGELGKRLVGIGMEDYQVDLTLEYLRSKGYSGADMEWVVRQGIEHRAVSPAYYRAIADREAPGVAQRAASAARRARLAPVPAPRVGGSAPPPPPPPPSKGLE